LHRFSGAAPDRSELYFAWGRFLYFFGRVLEETAIFLPAGGSRKNKRCTAADVAIS
jgi:hypothetical protein